MTNEKVTPKFKRTQYLVSKKFQLKYVGLILALMFLTAALCSYVVYYTTMMLLGEKLANVYPQGRLISIVNLVNIRILITVLLITPIVIVIGIFLSHKIAGPIFRMERFVDNMASGDFVSRIYLRQGDELMGLANKINELSESLKTGIAAQKSHLSKISMELERLDKVAGSVPTDVPVIRESIIKLDENVKGLINQLDQYKV